MRGLSAPSLSPLSPATAAGGPLSSPELPMWPGEPVPDRSGSSDRPAALSLGAALPLGAALLPAAIRTLLLVAALHQDGGLPLVVGDASRPPGRNAVHRARHLARGARGWQAARTEAVHRDTRERSATVMTVRPLRRAADPGSGPGDQGQCAPAAVRLGHDLGEERPARMPAHHTPCAQAQTRGRDDRDGDRRSSWAVPAARPAPVGPGGTRSGRVHDLLGPQELRIARLAARGLSNRLIGEEVGLSPRAVGTYLYRIYPRLGVTARTQLVAVLEEQG
ncbi:helix-turn-helix transcriptional regulator [Streptomyces sp. NPDC005483]|uniref:helix-turn-helix transcriptional regulator n=1 Tax=Streptomyces sp. NPDC005483 TaxID=3154882 RepID=UPI0033B8BC6F